MFRMELDNSQILQLLSFTVCSILAYPCVFNRAGNFCMLHRDRDVTGLDHVPCSALRNLCRLSSFFSYITIRIHLIT